MVAYSQRAGGRGLQVDRHPLGGSSHALGKPPGSLEAFWLRDLGNLKISPGDGSSLGFVSSISLPYALMQTLK